MLGFLSDQIAQGVLDAEPLANRPRGFAMFLLDLVKLRGGNYIEGRPTSARSSHNLDSPDGYVRVNT